MQEWVVQRIGCRSIRRQTRVCRAPCHTRKVTDLSNSHNVHGGERSSVESARPMIRFTDVGARSRAALIAGTVSAGHDTVVPTQGCIIWCPDGQSCSPVITGTVASVWDGAANEAWPPLIDVDIEPVTGIDIGVTECINRTPNTVSAISKAAVGAVPRRPCRFTECMRPMIPTYTPWGYACLVAFGRRSISSCLRGVESEICCAVVVVVDEHHAAMFPVE